MVYGNKTAESQSAQRTNERRRLLLRSKYAILFKYCNKDEFHVSANSASLRLIIVAEKPTLAVYGNKTTESQSAQRTNDGDDYCYEAIMQSLFKCCNKINFTTLRLCG